MKTYSFHYGDQMIDCRLDEKRIIGDYIWRKRRSLKIRKRPSKRLWPHPIDSKPFKELFKAGERWLSSPMIRPVLPIPMFSCQLFWIELNEVGIPDENIKIVFALGTHRDMTEAEMISEVGMEAAGRVAMYNSSAKKKEDFVHVGTTSFWYRRFGSIVM